MQFHHVTPLFFHLHRGAEASWPISYYNHYLNIIFYFTDLRMYKAHLGLFLKIKMLANMMKSNVILILESFLSYFLKWWLSINTFLLERQMRAWGNLWHITCYCSWGARCRGSRRVWVWEQRVVYTPFLPGLHEQQGPAFSLGSA